LKFVKFPNRSFAISLLIASYLGLSIAIGWGMWGTFRDVRLFLRSDLYGLTIDVVRTGELTSRYMRDLERYLETQDPADLKHQIQHVDILRGREDVLLTPINRMSANEKLKKPIQKNLKIYKKAMDNIRFLLINSPLDEGQKVALEDFIFKAEDASGTIYTRTQFYIQSNVEHQNHLQKTFSILLVGLVVILLMMLGGLVLALRKLHAAQGRAEKANQDKSTFLAAASHDMRQPLQAMTLFFYSLKKNISKPENIEIVAHLEKSTASLGQILNKLLDLSRLESGVIKIDKMSFPVGAIFNRLIDEYGPMAMEKNLKLKCVPCSLYAYSDPILFEGMLRNLLANAIKNTTSGRVLIGCRKKGLSQLVIQVWDTGPGIPADQKSKIFDEFYQLGVNPGNAVKGLGLGLSIVQKVSVLLGHEVGIESELGRGSMFSITLPRAENADEKNQMNFLGTSVSKTKKLSILVIEDDDAVRESLSNMLKSAHKNVVAAPAVDRQSHTMMACFPVQKPDVIIADYRLAENKTGVQAIDSLCDHYGCNIPAILLTGDTAPKRLQEIVQSGFLLVHKPIDGQELLQKIELAVAK